MFVREGRRCSFARDGDVRSRGMEMFVREGRCLFVRKKMFVRGSQGKEMFVRKEGDVRSRSQMFARRCLQKDVCKEMFARDTEYGIAAKKSCNRVIMPRISNSRRWTLGPDPLGIAGSALMIVDTCPGLAILVIPTACCLLRGNLLITRNGNPRLSEGYSLSRMTSYCHGNIVTDCWLRGDKHFSTDRIY